MARSFNLRLVALRYISLNCQRLWHRNWHRRGRLWSIRRRHFFPEELAAVEDLAAAHVEDVDGQHIVLEVVAEDVHVIAFGGGHALLLLELLHGGDQVAIAGGALVLFGLGGLSHARA